MIISVKTAQGYLEAGLCVLPAVRDRKRPAVGKWKRWTRKLPTACEVTAWFANKPDGVCLVAGKVSGNLECLDFDNHGELFEPWKARVNPALRSRLVVEQTPSGGFHVVYRSEAPVDGNMKLAMGNRDGSPVTLIETRGEGGLFLCAPTEGYELRQGDFTQIPTLTVVERTALLDAAKALDEERKPMARVRPQSWTQIGAPRDIRPTLLAAGWTFLGTADDGNEHWRRPGKTEGGLSATFNGEVFYVFSSNAAPFEPNRGYSKSQVQRILDAPRGAEKAPEVYAPPLIEELIARYPKMRPPLIHGLLRLGETMNVIAPPKTGKSWLVIDLALAVATGRDWFGFPCEQGNVLIIDNELHGETSANRIPKVIEARALQPEEWRGHIRVDNQRGRLESISDIARHIEGIKAFDAKLVIIDAVYRAMPTGTDENDNAAVAQIYNLIDRYAAALDCAFILIHHTTKGNQSAKSVTDVGAGAGSHSRAADTHLILRHHREPGVIVMESALRSFPPVEPICLRWSWPLWIQDDSIDPNALAGKEEARPIACNPSDIAGRLADIVPEQPVTKKAFIDIAKRHFGIQAKTAQFAVEEAIVRGLIRWERLANPPNGEKQSKFIVPAVSLPDADP